MSFEFYVSLFFYFSAGENWFTYENSLKKKNTQSKKSYQAIMGTVRKRKRPKQDN